jgi:hypothetical protein
MVFAFVADPVQEFPMERRFLVRCALGLFLAMSPHLAMAQVAGGTSLPADTVSSFIANPGQLLSQFPGGGEELRFRARDYMTSDKGALAALIGLLATANQDQRLAIAKGLADAAKLYAPTDLPEATTIQVAVAKTGLSEVIKAYASIAGDTGTASTDGGAGGGNGGGPTTNTTNTTPTNTGTTGTTGSNSGNNSTGLTTNASASGIGSSVSPQ